MKLKENLKGILIVALALTMLALMCILFKDFNVLYEDLLIHPPAKWLTDDPRWISMSHNLVDLGLVVALGSFITGLISFSYLQYNHMVTALTMVFVLTSWALILIMVKNLYIINSLY